MGAILKYTSVGNSSMTVGNLTCDNEFSAVPDLGFLTVNGSKYTCNKQLLNCSSGFSHPELEKVRIRFLE